MVDFRQVGTSAAYVEGGNERTARVIVICHDDALPPVLSLGAGENPITLDRCSFVISKPPNEDATNAEIEADLIRVAQELRLSTGTRRKLTARSFGESFNSLGELTFENRPYNGSHRYELVEDGQIATSPLASGGDIGADYYVLRLLAPSSRDLLPFAAVASGALRISREKWNPLVIQFVLSTLAAGAPATSAQGDVDVPLTDADSGAILFDLLTGSTTDDEDSVANLRATLSAGFLVGPRGLQREEQNFSVVRAAPGLSLRLKAHLDPVAMFDRERSFLAIEAPEGIIEATFTTTHGGPLQLRPLAAPQTGNPSRLYFYAQWTAAGGLTPRTSLLIDGDFDVVVPPVPDEAKRRSFGIVCGLSEREYVPLKPGDRLAFRAGYDAFYGTFKESNAPNGGAGARARASLNVAGEHDAGELTPRVVTSWMAILRQGRSVLGATVFFGDTSVVSETSDLAMFRRDTDANAASEAAYAGSVLDHAPLELVPRARAIQAWLIEPASAARSAANDPAAGHLIPLHPWQGFRADDRLDDAGLMRLAGMERNHLQVRRRNLLGPVGVAGLRRRNDALADPPPTRRYTPMGLEISEVGGRIDKVFLAGSTVDGGGDGVEVSLTNISHDLADALQRTDLFLVVDRWPTGSFAASYDGTLDDQPMRLRVSVHGWTFEIELPQGAANPLPTDPVVIVKGTHSASLKQLLQQPTAYTLPETFLSGGKAGIAEVAQKIAQLQQPSTDPEKLTELSKAEYKKYFEKIEDVFNDPTWTGVLIYGISLDPSALPDQITGLLAGADTLQKIDVHHLGFDVRRVEFSPGQSDVKRRPSPVFGLVDYVDLKDPEIKEPNKSFGLSLNKLLVQFLNGEIHHFEAEARLKVRHLFEGVVCGTLDGNMLGHDPVVKISGSYETRIDNGKSIDVYSFENTQNWRFDFNKEGDCTRDITEEKLGLLKSLVVRQFVFATKSVVVDEVSKKKSVVANFALDGDVNFNKWPPKFTIFEGDESISFRDLGIQLTFELSGRQVGNFHLDFRPGGFSLDFSKIRSLKGLLGKFPISFDRFEWWPTGIDFPKLGFFRLGGGRDNIDDSVKFGISFDLNLGSLGKISEVLGKFKMKILVGFGYDPNNIRSPKFSLGFKLESNGGAGLDVGIGNIIRIQADAYDYVKEDETYFIYALNARVVVFGQRVPPDKSVLNLFLFLDPGAHAAPMADPPLQISTALDNDPPSLSSALHPPVIPELPLVDAGGDLTLGWFAVLTSADQEEPRAFSIPLFALGQRVNPFQVAVPNNVRGIVNAVQANLGDIAQFKEALEKRPADVKKVTDFLVKKIQFAPSVDWVGALRIEIAKIIGLDLVIRDPDLYGAYFRFGPKDHPIFEIDIIYRKLSADLGLFGVDIIPPAAIRHITIGAASVTLPVIHLDIYTDGGFNVDVGFPAERNFDRSFAVEILPYTGAGGFYFGRLSGLGAKLAPRKVLDNDARYRGIFVYDPVTQLGFGARVGLGKRIDMSPFRAELSVTVYVYLEGAQGRLRILDPARLGDVPTELRPAGSYSVVSGAIGILGELKGSVDFPLIRCEVLITIYVEIGALVRTDDHILLYIEAGVRVSVSVVIARIRVFGHTFEIRVSFHFSARIRHETTSGSRRAGFETIYQFNPSLRALEKARAAGQRVWPLSASEAASLQNQIDTWTTQRIDWSLMPTLANLGRTERIKLAPWFVPDVTVGEELDATGAVVAQPHAVFNLYLSDDKKDASTAGYTPTEDWIWVMAAWLLFAGLDGHPEAPTGEFLDRPINLAAIEDLQLRLALAQQRPSPEGLPRYQEIRAFLSGPVELILTASADSSESRNATFYPLPAELALVRRFQSAQDIDEVVVELPAQGFLTETLEKEIEQHFDQLRAIFDERNDERRHAFGARAEPLAMEMFEEYAGYVLRALATKLRDIVATSASSPISIGEALGKLLIPVEGASPASSIAAMTGRFFQYGLAFPQPTDWAAVSDKIPSDLRALIDSRQRDTLPLYRYASLQLPVTRRGSGVAEYAMSIGLRHIEGISWFAIVDNTGNRGEIHYTLETSGEHSIDAVAKAATDLPAALAALQFASEVNPARIKPRRGSAPAFQRKLNTGQDAYLFGLPSELVGKTTVAVTDVRLEFRKVSTGERSDSLPKAEIFDASKFRIALAVEIGLKGVRAPGQNGLLDGVYEMSGAREYERRLLDRVFDPPPGEGVAASGGTAGPENIATVEMFLVDQDSESCSLLDTETSIIQTNLSVDRKPPTFRALAIVDETFSAPMNSVHFAEIVHRGAIVNSGGFWLASKDATLKQRIADAEKATQPTPGPVGPANDVRAFLVLTYDERVVDFSLANALKIGYAALQPRQAERLASVTHDFHAGDIAVVISTEGEQTGGPLPGTLPMRITVPNTARLYPSHGRNAWFGSTLEEYSSRRVHLDAAPRSADPVAELGSRFNLLEYAVSDGGDGIFRTTRRADVLPVGHVEQGEGPVASNEVPELLTFDLTLPLLRMTKEAVANPYSMSNPYSIVGKRVAIRFTLRDIYGNTLPIDPKFAATGELSNVYTLPYLDPLIGPGDLPHIKLAWDAASQRQIVIALTFALHAIWSGLGEDELDASGNDVTRALPAQFLSRGPEASPDGAHEKWRGWAVDIADRCHAAWERYQLADWQLEDADRFAVQTTLAPADQPSSDPYEPPDDALLPAEKTSLRVFYAAVLHKLDETEKAIRTHLANPRTNDNPEGTPWSPLAPEEIAGNVSVGVPRQQTALFVEARVALVVRRRNEAGEARNLQATSVVPPSYVNIFDQMKPPVIDFAASVIGNLLPNYLGALGAPMAAGKPGESLWFVAESMLPESAAPGDGQHPGYYALPPMRNAPASFTFENKKVWASGDSAAAMRPRVNLLDVDADLYAKRALQMIEDLLDPRAFKALIATPLGKSVIDGAVLAKEDLAKPLASTARRILFSPSDFSAPASVVASLTDRFKRTLAAVYSVDAVLTFEFLWKALPPSRPGSNAETRMRPILYGKVPFRRQGDSTEGISLDIGSLALPSKPGVLTSTFHILYDSRSGLDVDKGCLDGYTITHIQRMPQPDLAALGGEKISRRYRETQWLKFLQPKTIALTNDDVEIPIVLRQLPEQPRITNHTFHPLMPSAPNESPMGLGDLNKARSWVFDMTWGWKAASQDQLEIGIEYAQRDSRTLFLDPADLPSLLAGFTVALQEVWPEVLGQLSTGTALADGLLEFITEELDKLQGSSRLPKRAAALGVTPKDCLVVSLDHGIWKTQWQVDAGGKPLKADPSHYIQETSLPDLPAPTVNVTEGTARIIGVDILRFAQAQAELDLYRNRSFKLYGKLAPTAAPFVYHLGGIRAGRPVRPRLSHDALFESLRLQSVAEHISEILQALFPQNVANLSTTYDLDVCVVTAVLSIGRPADGAPLLPSSFTPPGTTMPRIAGLNRNSGDDYTIVQSIISWWRDQGMPPPRPGSPAEYRRLRLAFTVYRDGQGIAGAAPILQIVRIEVPLRSITKIVESAHFRTPLPARSHAVFN